MIYAANVDESGTWNALVSAVMSIGLVLLVLSYLLRFGAGEFHGGYRAPFAGVPLERQKVLREQVQKRHIDSPSEAGEVRAMAKLMRAGRRDLLVPAGMAIVHTTGALTIRDPWMWIAASFVLLVASALIVGTLRRGRAGSAFLRQYPAP